MGNPIINKISQDNIEAVYKSLHVSSESIIT